jgi:hypothetical protein
LEGTPRRVGERKVGNRLPGGYVGDSRQRDRQNASVHQNTKYQNVLGNLVYQRVFSSSVFVLLRSPR